MGSVVATLLAVYHQDRTGISQQVTGSLLGGGVLTNSETYLHEGGLAASVQPLDREQMGLSPGYRLYALADGWIALCALQSDELDRACAVIGARDPADLVAALSDASCDRTLAALRDAGVPSEPVKLDQGEPFLDDPLNRTLGLVTSYLHAEWGELEQVGALWSLGDLEVSLELAPPALGEHTVDVLTELGLDEDLIATLLAESVAVQSTSTVAPARAR
jgi:crotonobetainyl-CoA:carnitine CoA-transferase CaiB-like acyl-CoA transferase